MLRILRAVFFTLLSAGFAQALDLKFERYQLPNGLTVLLHENHQSPTVSCRLFYKTGSVHEHPGQTGIAHMLEHMLFKGTRKVGITDSVQDAQYLAIEDSLYHLSQSAKMQGDTSLQKLYAIQADSVLEIHRKLFLKDELWEAYQKAGGTGLNAYTTDLATAYFVTLPRDKVELFLWLEADRMQNAVLREFYPERDVVREERRMRYDDSPTGRYFESLEALFYEAHPYRNPTIGYAQDIEGFTREMAEEHYRKYYKPNNAILVFAGDFNSANIKPLVERYFSTIPKGESFAPIPTFDPEPAGQKRLVTYRNDAKPRLDLMFQTPGIPHTDLFALDILETVLNGRAGRLYKRLVEDEKLAVSASAGNSVRPGISAFEFEVILRESVDPQKVEKVLWEAIARLQDSLLTPRELGRVRNQMLASKAESFADMETVASMMAYFEIYGDISLLNSWMDHVSQVTPTQVQEVAKRYFRKEASTQGLLLSEAKP